MNKNTDESNRTPSYHKWVVSEQEYMVSHNGLHPVFGKDLTEEDIRYLYVNNLLVNPKKSVRGTFGDYATNRDTPYFKAEEPEKANDYPAIDVKVKKYNIEKWQKLGLDMDNSVELELTRLLTRRILDDEVHNRIIGQVKNFLMFVDGNTDKLFKFLCSAYQGIGMSNLQAGQYIADHFGDDFYLRRENLNAEEIQRNEKYK